MVNIYSIFVEDIEKAFRGHLPQNCINILARMSEENRALQEAVNKQQSMIEKLMKFIVLSKQMQAELNVDMQKYEKQFADPHGEYTKYEDMKEGE